VVRPVVPPTRGGSSRPPRQPSDPFLPASLRAFWKGEQVPYQVLANAGARITLTYDQLTPGVHRHLARADVLADHLGVRVQSHRKAIAHVRVFERVDPRIRVLAMDWSPKTLGALLSGAQLVHGERLRVLTWGQLLSIDGFDARSALEFALGVERRQTQYGRSLRRCSRLAPRADGHVG
jgi:hypothetical protein